MNPLLDKPEPSTVDTVVELELSQFWLRTVEWCHFLKGNYVMYSTLTYEISRWLVSCWWVSGTDCTDYLTRHRSRTHEHESQLESPRFRNNDHMIQPWQAWHVDNLKPETGLASNAHTCSIRTLYKFRHIMIDFCDAASASPELDRSSVPSPFSMTVKIYLLYDISHVELG